jgi:hypothetical protein
MNRVAQFFAALRRYFRALAAPAPPATGAFGRDETVFQPRRPR